MKLFWWQVADCLQIQKNLQNIGEILQEKLILMKKSVLATEKAKVLAQEHNIDLSIIAKEGIIRESDVQALLTEKHVNSRHNSSIYRYDKERIAIIGAGRGAEVLIDILDDQYDKQVVLLIDDYVREFPAYKVAPYGIFEFADRADREEFDSIIISLTANRKAMNLRARIFTYYHARGFLFTNVIAKDADVRRDVKIGQGNIIGAKTYIGTKTIIGNNNAISYYAVIGHHNVIGDCNLLAPGIITSGSVTIGSNCIVPTGVNFINLVQVGNNVVLPVGYNVTDDIPDNTYIKNI